LAIRTNEQTPAIMAVSLTEKLSGAPRTDWKTRGQQVASIWRHVQNNN